MAPTRRHSRSRGFTLIELMIVVAILGVLATIALGAYSKQVRKARKAEVIGDLSAITLRQKTFIGVNGHYASSATEEGPTHVYPDMSTYDSSQANPWDIADAGYTGPAADGEYARGGVALHGFDALRFMPEGGRSYCGYATISGWGSDAPDADSADTPPDAGIGAELFPEDAAALYARDWFYSYALCDFDDDGTYWALRTAHYTSDITFTSLGDYVENE